MRNRLVQIALSLALLVLLIQVVLIAPSRIRDSSPEDSAAILPGSASSGQAQPLPQQASDVDQVMEGMRMTGTQEGAKEWELWSKKAMSFKARETWELEEVKAVFFSDSGVTFTVTGKKGRVHSKTKNLLVEGDTVTRSSNGYVFRTNSMEYNSTTKKLNAPERVEMIGPKDEQGNSLRLTGASMEASLLTSSMEVHRDVKAEKTLDKGRKAYIRSQRAAFSGKDRTAKFFGDVILDMDTMRITGPSAQFEYAKESDMVKSVLFTGGARVSDADKWATAQNVKVEFDTNRFIFKGSPRVVQNNDELRGEEIVFLDGGKRVQVKRARAKVDEKRLENTN